MDKTSLNSPSAAKTISTHRALHTGHVAGLCELGNNSGKDIGFHGIYATPKALDFARKFVGQFKCNHPAVRISDAQWTDMIDELAKFYSSHRF